MVEEKMDINEMQLDSVPANGTTDAMFILVRQLQEMFPEIKQVWCMFVDLEKAFELVSRDVVWWTLQMSGVGE